MDETSLLEVSLVVDGELAEAVAEVLARFIPNGIVIESTQIAPDPNGEGHAAGPWRVCGYLPKNTEIETLRQKIEEALWHLSFIRPLPAPQFRVIAETNWVEAWKAHYHPIPIGQKLMIIPAWWETVPPGRTAVRIDPGMAFGTGTHPSTQLCLELAEQYLKPAQPVIDVGCGSGILSIAAIKLGACYALAVDVDPLAVQATRSNASLNEVTSFIETGVGSLAEIKSGRFSLRQASLVFANILAPVLIALLQEGLGELVAPDGVIILSGILAEQVDEIVAVATRYGMRVTERRQEGDWVALVIAPA